MVPVLAAGFVFHIIYAFVLNYMNYKARGTQRYAVANKAQTDDWASKNMLVLGIIVLGVLAFHLTHFWAKMQLPMFLGQEYTHDGAALLRLTFKPLWVLIIYVVWFVALWLHMNHGFWSAFHTLGLNNNIWMCRWKVTGIVVSSVIVLVFIAVAVKAYLVANGICCC
jgi:succinate dehydrogenase / fumarate reductase cytochrome b subunit